jgi:hypothetical protein
MRALSPLRLVIGATTGIFLYALLSLSMTYGDFALGIFITIFDSINGLLLCIFTTYVLCAVIPPVASGYIAARDNNVLPLVNGVLASLLYIITLLLLSHYYQFNPIYLHSNPDLGFLQAGMAYPLFSIIIAAPCGYIGALLKLRRKKL